MKSTTPKIKRSESGLGIESPSRSRCHFFWKSTQQTWVSAGKPFKRWKFDQDPCFMFWGVFQFQSVPPSCLSVIRVPSLVKKVIKEDLTKNRNFAKPHEEVGLFWFEMCDERYISLSSYPCNERLFIDLLVLLPGLASIAGAEDQFPPQESHPKRAVSDRKLLSKKWLNKFKHQKLPRNFEWMILELWSHWLIQL